MPEPLAGIDVVILAGGRGTRVAGVLGDIPKVLAPVGGRPFLDFLLEWLVSYGAERVILSLGHLSSAVTAHLARAQPAVACVPAIEPQPLGTAGALRFVRHLVASDPFLAMNGDSFVNADLGEFVAAHRASGAALSLVATEVPDAGRFGALELGEDSRVAAFHEKSARPGRGYVNAGIYLFSPAFGKTLAAMPGPSLERDVFEKLPAGTIHAHAGAFDFFDIGTPESLAAAAERATI